MIMPIVTVDRGLISYRNAWAEVKLSNNIGTEDQMRVNKKLVLHHSCILSDCPPLPLILDRRMASVQPNEDEFLPIGRSSNSAPPSLIKEVHISWVRT